MKILAKMIFSLHIMTYLNSANPLSIMTPMTLKEIIYELDHLDLQCKTQIMCNLMVPKVLYEKQTDIELACQASKSLETLCKTGKMHIQKLCHLMSLFLADCHVNNNYEEDLHSTIRNLSQNFKELLISRNV